MGIFLLTGFPKVFYYSHSKNFLPTLLISNWDNVVRPIVAVQCRLYILKDLAMSYRYSYSIPTCVYFHPAMYNNVLRSYRSFLLTVSSIASCISNCTIVGFVSRPCKKMAQQGFPFSHLEIACWAISVERLYLNFPTCPASYFSDKKQTE